MDSHTVPAYQHDADGFFVGVTEADESPLEPGVFLVPALCTLEPPPAEIAEGLCARWSGTDWELVDRAAAPADQPSITLAKLKDFLARNPDVAALLDSGQPTL
jgi:hypothetical protein